MPKVILVNLIVFLFISNSIYSKDKLEYELINHIVCGLPMESLSQSFIDWDEDFQRINPPNYDNLFREKEPLDLTSIFDEEAQSAITQNLGSATPSKLKKRFLDCSKVLCSGSCNNFEDFTHSISFPIIERGKDGNHYGIVKHSYAGYETGETYLKIFRLSGSKWELIYQEIVAIS